MAPSNLCAVCKGRKLMCGKSTCLILEKIRAFNEIKTQFNKKLNKTEIFGASPPSLFVGEYGYPNVRIGPLVPTLEGDTSFLDSPIKWENKSIKAIIKYRSLLVLGETKSNINITNNRHNINRNSIDNRILDSIQEIALSIKPVDSEIKLKKKPNFNIIQSSVAPPISPKGDLLKFTIAENPKIPSKTDYIVNDDLKATEQIISLYENGNFDEYYIIKLMSAGILGINKKIVPTRWSITSVQDILGRYLRNKIINYNLINDYEVYYSSILGNNYTILLIPNYYKYELMEVWQKGSLYGGLEDSANYRVLGDYEDLKVKGYAKETTGAFYAGRLSLMEHFEKRKRQGAIVVFREITNEYYAPVGVWQIRAGVKKALKNKPYKFNTLNEALNKINELTKTPIKYYQLKSKIICNKRQTTIEEFFR